MSGEKILILSQLGWPPEFNAQILRLSKISKYLAKYGLQPIIISPPQSKHSLKDYDLYKDIRKYVHNTYYIGRQTPSILNRPRVRNLLKIFFIPDSKFYYITYLNDIIRIIKRFKIKAIFTSTPPSGLILGYIIKKRLLNKIIWIADFADPWTFYNLYFAPTYFHKYFDVSFEKKILKTSDYISFSSRNILEKYANKYDFIYDKSFWLPNGYDEDDFAGLTPINHNKFTFVYSGTIYPHFDISFLNSFKKLEKKYDFQILFIGKMSQRALDRIASKRMDSIKILGFLKHRDNLKYMISADSLLFGLSYEFNDILPSRLPEYLRSNNIILAYTNPDSCAGRIIKDTGSGIIISKKDILNVNIIEDVLNNSLHIEPDNIKIKYFSWDEISKKLINVVGGM